MRLIVSFFTFLALATPATAAGWGPWEDTGRDGLPAEAYHRGERIEASATNAHWAFALMLRAYQLTLSGQDNVKCPMYPSCSRYAMEAYAAYGPVVGTLMTAERLLRDHGMGHERYRTIQVGGRVLLHDPPSDHAPW